VPLSHLSMCLQHSISASFMLRELAKQADAGATIHAKTSIAAVSGFMEAPTSAQAISNQTGRSTRVDVKQDRDNKNHRCSPQLRPTTPVKLRPCSETYTPIRNEVALPLEVLAHSEAGTFQPSDSGGRTRACVCAFLQFPVLQPAPAQQVPNCTEGAVCGTAGLRPSAQAGVRCHAC
jgi:hypothetical protein